MLAASARDSVASRLSAVGANHRPAVWMCSRTRQHAHPKPDVSRALSSQAAVGSRSAAAAPSCSLPPGPISAIPGASAAKLHQEQRKTNHIFLRSCEG